MLFLIYTLHREYINGGDLKLAQEIIYNLEAYAREKLSHCNYSEVSHK